MSTRGFLGFVIDGRELISYNHSDSYPAGLGVDVLFWLKTQAVPDLDTIGKLARNLRVVNDEVPPTDADIVQLAEFSQDDAYSDTRPDWYWLLRNTHGVPGEILRAGVIEDHSTFPLDPWAEWGYLIDLDTETFEVYRGCQWAPHNQGRFVGRGDDDTAYPAALVAFWPLSDLPSNAELLAVGRWNA